MRYELSEQVLNNLIIFLDRVSFQSLKEHTALSEILGVLNNPIKEEEIKEIE